ncbi:transposase [Streptomyces sp. A 4/2]|uniref:transposase n=1 Tax=Streptomyces sp. A 4/2 TaxID=2934314 RepID=UPI0035AB9CC8
MIRRHDLSDAEWQLLKPLLPRSAKGRPRLDDRTVLNGILWKYRTGVAWRGVPRGTAPGPPCIRASGAGPGTEPSTGYCGPRKPRRTRLATSTGSCRSTPLSCGHTSTPPGREKGASEPGARSLAGRPDQQTPPGRRRPGPTAGPGPDRWEHQ